MYLKQHKVYECNPKESGWYHTSFDDHSIMFRHYFNGKKWYGSTPKVWYSEVTERLYTEAEMKIAIQVAPGYSGYTTTEIEEILLSQLNKDKDK